MQWRILVTLVVVLITCFRRVRAEEPTWERERYRPESKEVRCDHQMDERGRATLYLKNLRDFARHMPLKLSDLSHDLVEQNTAGALSQLDRQSKIRGSKFLNEKAFIGLLGLVPMASEAATLYRLVSDMTITSMERVPLKFPTEVGDLELSTVAEQFAAIAKARDEAKTFVEDFSDELNRLIDEVEIDRASWQNGKNSAATSLAFQGVWSEQPLARQTLCQVLSSKYSDKGAEERAQLLCQKNIERPAVKRGTLACAAINRLARSERARSYAHVMAQFAAFLARTIVFPDPFKLALEGTTTRIEVVEKCRDCLGAIVPYSTTRTWSVRGPGREKILCSMLKAPEYEGLWLEAQGQRFLNPALPVKALPVAFYIELREGRKKYPDIERFHLDSEKRPRFLRFNDHKSLAAETSAVYVNRVVKNILEMPVKEVLPDLCRH